MDIESYISSGILELFVAGVLLEDEAKEVAALIKEHPKLAEEVAAIEEAIIGYTQLNSPVLRPSLKEKLFEQLDFKEVHKQGTPILEQAKNGQTDPLIRKLDTPILSQHTLIPSSKAPIGKSPVVALYKSRLQKWQYVAIAATVLLVSSLIINLYLFTQWTGTKQDLLTAQKHESILAKKFKTVKANFKQSNTQVRLFRASSTKTIQLAGLQIAPEAKAVVYWNPTSKKVYLDANHMPKPPKNKQYQLWYIDKDGPKDAGIFDYHTNKDNFYQLKDVGEQAQAFAISLEPLGGQPNPTEVHAVGKL